MLSDLIAVNDDIMSSFMAVISCGRMLLCRRSRGGFDSRHSRDNQLWQQGLLSTCHHMITITNNAVVAQLARAPSWSLGGRWFDASRWRWNPHIRDTEKPWFIARSIALMDAYMDAMTRGLKSWWLAGNRCISETAATWTWMMAFRKASMGTMRTN